MDKFKSQLAKCRFFTEEDQKTIEAFMESIGCKDGWMNGDQVNKRNAKYPYLSRDHAGKILELVNNSQDDSILLVGTVYILHRVRILWLYPCLCRGKWPSSHLSLT